MKLLVLSLTALVAVHANDDVFRPHRISYNELAQDSSFEKARASFMDALQHDGVVSVTGIPNLHKQDTLANLHACAVKSKTTQEHVYDDGTRRRTMAAHTVPGGVQIMHHQDDTSSACKAFDHASRAFRQQVGLVTQVFSERLASILDHEGPLLSTKAGYDFETIETVVENGEHLEHFHSYQKSSASSQGFQGDETIDIHLDQGLFLVFSPALLVQDSNIVEILAEGFHVQLQDGKRALVQFDEEDDLVFLLGDGVNQYVNPKLKSISAPLRAAPHALSMPKHEEDEARVWYGRMVLPPYDAVHPQHGETFGKLREMNIQGEHKELACSSNMVARQLEKTSCEADTIFCWEKCMSPSEYNVSKSICAEQGLNLTCTNEARQLYVSGHGPFFPGCIDIENAEEVIGNPVHPSNQTSTSSGPVMGYTTAVVISAVIGGFFFL